MSFLFIGYWLLFTVYCLLFTVYYLLFTFPFQLTYQPDRLCCLFYIMNSEYISSSKQCNSI